MATSPGLGFGFGLTTRARYTPSGETPTTGNGAESHLRGNPRVADQVMEETPALC